jgi:oxygen-dependent protoporphyrinogen oxidase
MKSKKIAIIGAGISGAGLAWLLSPYAGKEAEITVFDKNAEAGGCIKTLSKNGYLAESGPNGVLASRQNAVELFNKADLQDIEYSGDHTRRRYIQMNERIHLAPLGPLSALSTPLLSLGGKLRMLKEPFVKTPPSSEDESMLEFASRRIGAEAASRLVATLVCGVYAGDAAKLSVKSAFPRLYELDKNYGSLVKGMIKSAKEAKASGKKRQKNPDSFRLISSSGGMQGIVKALAAKAEGVTFRYNSTVTAIKKDNGGYIVEADGGAEHYDIAVLCCNAHDAAGIVETMDAELAAAYRKVVFSPVFVSAMGFDKKDIRHALDGFGYLVAPTEQGMVLGCLFSSTLFKGRAPEDKALLTAICVGDMNRDRLKHSDEELSEQAFKQIEPILGLTKAPETVIAHRTERAIPQYYIGHSKITDAIDNFCGNNAGFFAGGNTAGGISVSDCLKTSQGIAEKIGKLI